MTLPEIRERLSKCPIPVDRRWRIRMDVELVAKDKYQARACAVAYLQYEYQVSGAGCPKGWCCIQELADGQNAQKTE